MKFLGFKGLVREEELDHYLKVALKSLCMLIRCGLYDHHRFCIHFNFSIFFPQTDNFVFYFFKGL